MIPDEALAANLYIPWFSFQSPPKRWNGDIENPTEQIASKIPEPQENFLLPKTPMGTFCGKNRLYDQTVKNDAYREAYLMKKIALLTTAFILALTGCAATGEKKDAALAPTTGTEIPADATQEPTPEPGGTRNFAAIPDNNQDNAEPGKEAALPPDYGSLTQAPLLTVSTQNDADRVTASCGNSEWNCLLPDGTATTLIACGAHPLDWQNHPILYTAFPAGSLSPSEDSMDLGAMLPAFYLDFGEIPPETVSAVRWSSSFIGNAQNHTESETVTVESEEGTITLLPMGDGDYIYEISAYWGETGSASYVFRTLPLVREEQEAESAEIIQALDGLDYQPYTCDGLPEYRLTAEDGTVYAINLSEKWVWRGNSEQADLPEELSAQLKDHVRFHAGSPDSNL